MRSAAKLKLSTLFSGILIFFTDSGNSLILGPVYRPVFDKLRICREKLAYIIDSTSSPVCVLIPIISWGAYTMGLMEQAYTNEGIDKDGFTAFQGSMVLSALSATHPERCVFVALFNVYLGHGDRTKHALLSGELVYDESSEAGDELSPTLQRFGARG